MSSPTGSPPSAIPERLLRLPDVKARVGLSRSTIYARMAEGTFPRARQLSARSVAWLESEIADWVARVAAGEVAR